MDEQEAGGVQVDISQEPEDELSLGEHLEGSEDGSSKRLWLLVCVGGGVLFLVLLLLGGGIGLHALLNNSPSGRVGARVQPEGQSVVLRPSDVQVRPHIDDDAVWRPTLVVPSARIPRGAEVQVRTDRGTTTMDGVLIDAKLYAQASEVLWGESYAVGLVMPGKERPMLVKIGQVLDLDAAVARWPDDPGVALWSEFKALVAASGMPDAIPEPLKARIAKWQSVSTEDLFPPSPAPEPEPLCQEDEDAWKAAMERTGKGESLADLKEIAETFERILDKPSGDTEARWGAAYAALEELVDRTVPDVKSCDDWVKAIQVMEVAGAIVEKFPELSSHTLLQQGEWSAKADKIMESATLEELAEYVPRPVAQMKSVTTRIMEEATTVLKGADGNIDTETVLGYAMKSVVSGMIDSQNRALIEKLSKQSAEFADSRMGYLTLPEKKQKAAKDRLAIYAKQFPPEWRWSSRWEPIVKSLGSPVEDPSSVVFPSQAGMLFLPVSDANAKSWSRYALDLHKLQSEISKPREKDRVISGVEHGKKWKDYCEDCGFRYNVEAVRKDDVDIPELRMWINDRCSFSDPKAVRKESDGYSYIDREKLKWGGTIEINVKNPSGRLTTCPVSISLNRDPVRLAQGWSWKEAATLYPRWRVQLATEVQKSFDAAVLQRMKKELPEGLKKSKPDMAAFVNAMQKEGKRDREFMNSVVVPINMDVYAEGKKIIGSADLVGDALLSWMKKCVDNQWHPAFVKGKYLEMDLKECAVLLRGRGVDSDGDEEAKVLTARTHYLLDPRRASFGDAVDIVKKTSLPEDIQQVAWSCCIALVDADEDLKKMKAERDSLHSAFKTHFKACAGNKEASRSEQLRLVNWYDDLKSLGKAKLFTSWSWEISEKVEIDGGKIKIETAIDSWRPTS